MKPKTILCLDDEINVLKSLKRLLRKHHYHVLTASTGKEALQILRNTPVELILSDYRMPHMTGVEFLQKAKEIRPNAVRMILSGYADLEAVLDAINKGEVYRFFTKPWRPGDLVEGIKDALYHFEVLEENRRLQKTLEQQNNELQSFNRIVSHDLKSPLLTINLASENLQDFYADNIDEQGHDYIKAIRKTVHRMKELIDDLLKYSTLDSQKTIQHEKIDLSDLVQDVLTDLTYLIQETKASIKLGDLPTIWGNPLLIRQLFQNLLSNALKYHKPQKAPVVEVSAKSSSDTNLCTIMVQDNGIGMEEHELESIFEPFVRLANAKNYEGSGIGLATCKKIMANHNGELMVESQPHQGSKFLMSFQTG